MDVEDLIERLKNAGGMEAYFNDRYNGLYHQAADTITQLRADLEYEREHADAYYEECGQWEAENEKMRAELEQVKQESDAAVSDMETIMAYGGGNLDTCQYCKNGQCYVRGGTKLCLPKWRGPQKED